MIFKNDSKHRLNFAKYLIDLSAHLLAGFGPTIICFVATSASLSSCVQLSKHMVWIAASIFLKTSPFPNTTSRWWRIFAHVSRSPWVRTPTSFFSGFAISHKKILENSENSIQVQTAACFHHKHQKSKSFHSLSQECVLNPHNFLKRLDNLVEVFGWIETIVDIATCLENTFKRSAIF